MGCEYEDLAIHGGPAVIAEPFRPYRTMGEEEERAVSAVMQSGVLSQFLGCWHDDFYGGEQVQELEREWAEFFRVKHAITVNSWTSGLIAAVGAIGIEPGDEVIVSPWTMCASATAIVHWNAIPVFADIDHRTFNICPQSVRENITEKTRAILAIDIFGQSSDIEALMEVANEFDLTVIIDCAQSPGALFNSGYAGTSAHIGGYSLNYHKHIHTGEGGVIVTDDDELAERMRMIRNHAEAVIANRPEMPLTNMIGYNFRLGELECAIGREQLKKLPALIVRRQQLAERLSSGLAGLRGLVLPWVDPRATHVYYIYAMQFDEAEAGCKRSSVIEALQAEGIELTSEYQNIHLLPMFQNKQAYGTGGFPWSASFSRQDIDYRKGICPTAETINDKRYLGFNICSYDLSEDDIDHVILAFRKVWHHLIG